MIEVIQYSIYLLTVAGLGWYAVGLISATRKEEQEDYIQPTGESDVTQEDLIDLGTGAPAEQVLTAALASTHNQIFIWGAMNRSVYSWIRDYAGWNVELRILGNPSLGGKMYLDSLKDKYAAIVRETDEIPANLFTLFQLDTANVFMIRTENHNILRARDLSVGTQVMAVPHEQWRTAQKY